VLGVDKVLGGLCRISAMIAEPGRIRHAGIEPYIAFGELDRHTSRRCERLQAAFERAGVWAEVPPDIQSAMWEKFVFIAAMSGVGAVTRMPVGIFRSIPETRRMLVDAVQESVDVALGRGIGAPANLMTKTMDLIDGLPPGATASMQRDIMEGRPSELDSQNGAVVRLGGEADVPTPAHSFLYASLLPQELQARRQIEG
ncbi:MAG: ketopantoate reductase family protein, partial [Anaerolineales bacterium]